jgi:hypothetical protein
VAFRCNRGDDAGWGIVTYVRKTPGALLLFLGNGNVDRSARAQSQTDQLILIDWRRRCMALAGLASIHSTG